MGRIYIATRGASDWRSRLADPETHWKRKASAMEAAVSWEEAARLPAGLPQPITTVFRESALGEPELLLALAEHKVRLDGQGGAAQCDVWALVKTAQGIVSLAVEAKANEPFGNKNESLALWLTGGKSADSGPNRAKRWQHVDANLPAVQPGAYNEVPFQILQRCAAAVIEARRFRLRHAVFLVQSFGAPETSFRMYERLAVTLSLPAEKRRLSFTVADDIQLGIGWVESDVANDAQMAAGLDGEANTPPQESST